MKENWLDFKAIKERVPLVQVLTRYNVQLKRVNSESLKGNCPLPSHTSKSKDTFCVNETKNVWYCHSDSCKQNGKKAGGNVIDFVQAMENCSAYEAAKKLSGQFVGDAVTTSKPAPEQKSSTPSPVVEENRPLAFTLKDIAYCDYLNARGISEETATKFGVGFFPGKGSMAGRVVIPIHDETGALVAYAGRAIDGTEPKYKLPQGFHKSKVLYNRNIVKGDTTVIVEGFFGTLMVSEAGFPCVGLMGKTLSEAQENLLNFKFITLMLDPDEPGKTATNELVLRLSRNHYVRVARNEKAPDEMTAEEIKNVIRYCCPVPKR
jgi:DNA primase